MPVVPAEDQTGCIKNEVDQVEGREHSDKVECFCFFTSTHLNFLKQITYDVNRLKKKKTIQKVSILSRYREYWHGISIPRWNSHVLERMGLSTQTRDHNWPEPLWLQTEGTWIDFMSSQLEGQAKSQQDFWSCFLPELAQVLNMYLQVADSDREKCGWRVSLNLHAWMARWGWCSASQRNLSQHISQNRPARVTKIKWNSPFYKARCHVKQILQQSPVW